jgi:hypothetical protein
MHTRGLLALVLFAAVAMLPAGVIAADHPTAGLLAGHNQTTPPISVTSGTTSLGPLNAQGERVFNLVNASGKPITSLVVTITAEAPLPAIGHACSSLNALLKSCTAEVKGNVVTLNFGGSPDIKTDAQFRLGFSPGVIAGPWPAGAAVSVAVSTPGAP